MIWVEQENCNILISSNDLHLCMLINSFMHKNFAGEAGLANSTMQLQ